MSDPARRRWPRWSWDNSPRTALGFGAAGALIGLALAGYGLFTAQGSAIRGVPAEDAAMINGVPVLRSDLTSQIESGLGKPASRASAGERGQALADMIREELMVQRGLELGEPTTDPDTRAALVSAVEQQIAVDATSAVPAEADLRAFYDRNRGHYAGMGYFTVRDLVPVGAAATGTLDRAAAALRARQPIAAVMAQFHLKDSGKVDGEELHFAARIHLGPTLFATARALGDGQVAGPIAASDGPHLLYMVHNVQPRPRAFEDARSQVYSDYKADLGTRLRDGEYRYLRGRADIQIAPDLK